MKCTDNYKNYKKKRLTFLLVFDITIQVSSEESRKELIIIRNLDLLINCQTIQKEFKKELKKLLTIIILPDMLNESSRVVQIVKTISKNNS